MNGLSDGRSSSGRTVATSTTESPYRTPTRGAAPSVEYTPYGRWSSPNPAAPSLTRRLQQTQSDQVVERLGDAARPVRREPPSCALQVALPRQGHEIVRIVVVEHLHDVRDASPVEGEPRRQQDVEESQVLEAGRVVPVAHRVVETGGALERRLAIERGVDPGGHRGGSGEQVGLDAAGAQLEAILGLAARARACQPSRGRLRLRQLHVHTGVSDPALAARGVDGRRDPPDISGHVVEVADRGL